MDDKYICLYAQLLCESLDKYKRISNYSLISQSGVKGTNDFWRMYKIIPDISPRAIWVSEYFAKYGYMDSE